MASTVAEYERETFSIQEKEWSAWSIDNTSPTPNCDVLAASRNMDRLELLNRIGYKTTLVFQILGTQQYQVDLLETCTTMAELDAARQLINLTV